MGRKYEDWREVDLDGEEKEDEQHHEVHVVVFHDHHLLVRLQRDARMMSWFSWLLLVAWMLVVHASWSAGDWRLCGGFFSKIIYLSNKKKLRIDKKKKESVASLTKV